MKDIKIFHTHIEVSPYYSGENEKIEKMQSIWIENEYRYEPIGYYIENDTLYLPRGFNIYILEKEFNSISFIIYNYDEAKKTKGVKMKVPPRDRIQEEAIEYLSSTGKFEKALVYSQQALILDTGDGKTYTTVHSILNYRMRAIIITHQDKIKTQWINTFLDKTTVSPDKIVDINNSSVITKIMNGKKEGYYYFVNHQTLTSYARAHGWLAVRKFFKKISVGIKVFDEAHLSFKNVLRIDMFSDTFKTFYLTANFKRSDPKEEYLFKRCFSSVYKFGEETKEYEEKRKHIIYVPVLYRSNPNPNHLTMAQNSYGFSVLGFSKYALHLDTEKKQLKVFSSILEQALKFEGKILITTPKIDDTNFIKNIIDTEFSSLYRSVSTINSTNTKEENIKARESDIICSTIKSCGTGVDIKSLRCIINLEPFSSTVTANQLAGRLREYASDKDTYFFDLIDLSFPSCERQYKTKLKFLREKCKEIRVIKI